MIIGKNCKISSKCSIYGEEKIKIGNNVRIDDFVVLSAGEGGIEIGDNVHISVYTSLQGKGKIYVGNYATISSRVAIYSSNDDYSGEFMTNPMNEKYSNVTHGDVIIEQHSIIGAGSVILPGVTIGASCAVGALSLVKENLKSFCIYGGVPAKYIKQRSMNHRYFIK